jgi:hypothetical protein
MRSIGIPEPAETRAWNFYGRPSSPLPAVPSRDASCSGPASRRWSSPSRLKRPANESRARRDKVFSTVESTFKPRELPDQEEEQEAVPVQRDPQESQRARSQRSRWPGQRNVQRCGVLGHSRLLELQTLPLGSSWYRSSKVRMRHRSSSPLPSPVAIGAAIPPLSGCSPFLPV